MLLAPHHVTPPGSPSGMGRKKPLTLLPLVMLIFFEVSGGPFGTEVSGSGLHCHMTGDAAAHMGDLRHAGHALLCTLGSPTAILAPTPTPLTLQDAVTAAGPLLCIIGFIVFPLIWSVPEALMTAELATAFPENSGYVAWVTAAFGPMWGFQVEDQECAMHSIIGGLCLYFCLYLTQEGLWSWLSGVTDNG